MIIIKLQQRLQYIHENVDSIIKFNMYCLNPSLEFYKLLNKKPYALFLTSSTLTPFYILEQEYNIKFDIIFENDHIYKKNQFKFYIISNSNLIFNSIETKENIVFTLDDMHRGDEKMIISLGNNIVSLSEANKNGSLLIYFPSLAFYKQYSLIWKDNNIIDKLSENNNIYVSNKTLRKINKIQNEKNYVFFAIFDINTSPEEIFFDKVNITMVVLLGFPSDIKYSYDDKIQLKLKYLNDNNNFKICENSEKITGEKWLKKNKMDKINIFLSKTLNLLCGYGVLICIDDRYISALNEGYFSLFLKNNCEIINISTERDFDNLVTFLGEINIQANFRLNDFNKDNTICEIKEDDYEEKENYFINREYENKLFKLEVEPKIIKKFDDLDDIEKEIQRIQMDADKIDFLQQKTNRDLEVISSGEEEESEDERSEKYTNKKINNRRTIMREKSLYKTKRKKKNKNKKKKKDEEENNNAINEEEEKKKKEEEERKKKEEEELKKKQELEMKLLDSLNKNESTENSNEKYECFICFKISDQNKEIMYSKTKCNHVLCNNCWANWLLEKYECPLCKAKVRPKTLKRLIFEYQ